MLSNVPYPYTDEDAQYWIGIVHSSEFNLNIFHDGLLIGGIGLTPQGDDSCELGYWLGFEYWGKGTLPRRVTRCLITRVQRPASDRLERMFTKIIRLLPKFLKKSGLSK